MCEAAGPNSEPQCSTSALEQPLVLTFQIYPQEFQNYSLLSISIQGDLEDCFPVSYPYTHVARRWQEHKIQTPDERSHEARRLHAPTMSFSSSLNSNNFEMSPNSPICEIEFSEN